MAKMSKTKLKLHQEAMSLVRSNKELTMQDKECISCGEILEDDEVTYCPDCDAPICHECLDNGCMACPDR